VTTQTSDTTSTAGTAGTAAPRPVQVHSVYIRATAERIWAAITDPEWNGRYGYGAPSTFELRPGGAFRSVPGPAMIEGAKQMGWPVPETVVDGEVLEADPPHRLVQTWRMAMDPQAAAEGFTRLTYEITEGGGAGVCRLTVTHEVGSAPSVAAMVEGAPGAEQQQGGGGWPWVLSDLKSLLETGSSFTGA
jgi:uncharacterized protein YndB with AHSA1/START domain